MSKTPPPGHRQLEQPITVQAADIDELGHVNNVVYLQWVQDIAAAHWRAIATPEILEKYVWVARRHEIDYYLPAMPGDALIARTWVDQHNGATCLRCVQILRNNTLLAEALTTWCMLDASSMRIRRIDATVANCWLENH